METHPLHHYLRPAFRLVHGLCGQETEGKEHQGTVVMERYDESGGGDLRWFAYHQGFQCRGEDEPQVRPCELFVS